MVQLKVPLLLAPRPMDQRLDLTFPFTTVVVVGPGIPGVETVAAMLAEGLGYGLLNTPNAAAAVFSFDTGSRGASPLKNVAMEEVARRLLRRTPTEPQRLVWSFNSSEIVQKHLEDLTNLGAGWLVVVVDAQAAEQGDTGQLVELEQELRGVVAAREEADTSTAVLRPRPLNDEDERFEHRVKLAPQLLHVVRDATGVDTEFGRGSIVDRVSERLTPADRGSLADLISVTGLDKQ